MLMQVWGWKDDFSHITLPESRRKANKNLVTCIQLLDKYIPRANELLK